MTEPSFAVVIPMYNEEAGAEKCVWSISKVLALISGRNALIIVNDGSIDKTADILKEMRSLFPEIIIVNHEKNKGYGAALSIGIQRAAKEDFEYVLFMDSDLTNDPKDIPKFAEKMIQGFDVIKASRFIKGGGMKGIPLKRKIISVAGGFIASLLFGLGVRDCTNGFRAVKTDILKKIKFTESGFPVIMEELYVLKFLAKKYCEIPVILANREGGQRPTSFNYKPEIFFKYLKFAILAFLSIPPRSFNAN